MTQALEKIVEPDYFVVKFLEKPRGILDDYVCVPEFWTSSTGPADWIVSVAYPEEDVIKTTHRTKTGEAPQHHWGVYQAIVKYIPESYSDSEIWIAKHHASKHQKGYQSASARQTTTHPGLKRSSGDFQSSLNTKILQTIVAPSKPSQKPMMMVPPIVRNRPESTASGADINKNRSQTAKAVESTKQYSLEQINPIDLKIYAGQSSSNLTKNSSQQLKYPVQKQFAPVIQNMPQTPEIWRYIPVCVENLVRETRIHEIPAARSNNVQVMMLTAPTIKTPSNEGSQSLPRPIAEHNARQHSQNANDQIPSTSNTQSIPNERTPEQNNVENTSARRRVSKPKYNPNHSKWTLKYRRRERGLEELVPDTGIFVNSILLAHCKRASTNCNTLARMLLTEVFSDKALTSCSLNVARSKVHNGKELDEFAIKVIFKFVEDYSSENHWDKFDYKSVLKSMHNEIRIAKNAN